MDLDFGSDFLDFDFDIDLVTSVAFAPDGQTVLTGNFDGTLRLWDVASGKELRVFKDNLE